jgi:carbon storage regulator CsrA
MLQLIRKKYQKIIINNNIEVIVLEINIDYVVLGFKSPKGINILRKEILNIKENKSKN